MRSVGMCQDHIPSRILHSYGPHSFFSVCCYTNIDNEISTSNSSIHGIYYPSIAGTFWAWWWPPSRPKHVVQLTTLLQVINLLCFWLPYTVPLCYTQNGDASTQDRNRSYCVISDDIPLLFRSEWKKNPWKSLSEEVTTISRIRPISSVLNISTYTLGI